MPKPFLSIIIPSFQRSDVLPLGLASIKKQVTLFDYEIIVINDGLEDRTEDICKEFGAKYYFTGERNINGIKWRCPGPALNLGVSVAQADIILLTAPEMYLVQDSILQELTAGILENKNTVCITNGHDDQTGDFLSHLRQGGTWYNYPLKNNLKFLHTEYPFCLCMSRYKFNSIGGYDTQFSEGVGFDDTDFCFRLTQSGGFHVKKSHLDVVHLYHNRYVREGIEQKIYASLLEKNKQLYITKNNTRKYL